MTFDCICLVIWFCVFAAVKGCGPISAGQEKSIKFTVTDFKLPPVMVYSVDPMAKSQVAAISSSKIEAETFVRKLIEQTVKDVLYQQGRSAFLADNVISSILQQLEVQISYEPLKCDKVVTNPTIANNGAVAGMKNCIIVGDTVTNICELVAAMCQLPMHADKYKSIPPENLSISGNLKISNAIMANWSNQMWESVLNRVLRTIIFGPYGSYFYGALIKIN